MGVLHIRQQLLASLYEKHSKLEGSFLSRREIISHVSAAETNRRIAFIDLEKGTVLYQWVRPGGWIGDYYAGGSDVTPSELGASPEVTDPLDETRTVPRVQLEFVVARVDKLSAAVTTAKAVVDTWSVKNVPVPTEGGAEQYYAPIVAAGKQGALVLVKPEGASPEQLFALEAIAEKNSLRFLSRQEIGDRYHVSRFVRAYQRTSLPASSGIASSPLSAIDQQTKFLNATLEGHYHEAIEMLENLLMTTPDQASLEILKATLGALYGAVGRLADAKEHLESFISYYENSQDPNFIAAHQHLYFYAKYHLGLSLLNPEESIACLSQLAEEMQGESLHSPSGTSSSSGPVCSLDSTPKASLYLDLAIRYNQVASQYSDDITFHDFDENGKQKDTKNEASKKAENYARLALNENALALPETIVAFTELGFSLRKQRRYEEAVHVLFKAKRKLEKYQEKVTNPLMIKDIKQQHLSLRLGIGLALCRCRELKSSPKNFDKHTYMENLHDDLNAIDIMTRRFLFTRWIGNNDGDLFITGWFDAKNDDNHARGTNLIRLYREVFPLEIDRICDSLRKNTITSLELPYLGEAPPTGISDENFEKLMEALSVNTSLQKLYLRKFSNSVDPVANPYRRFPRLAAALSAAQALGQRLTYLSYSASRYDPSEAASMVEFLNHNESLVVLQPSFYDIESGEIFKEYGRALSRLPRLATLLTGILRGSNSGKMIGESCESNPAFKYMHPFPFSFFETQVNEKRNNKALFDSRDRLIHGIPVSIAKNFEILTKAIETADLNERLSPSRRHKTPRTFEMKKVLNQISGFNPTFREHISKILQMSKHSFGDTHPVTTAALNCL